MNTNGPVNILTTISDRKKRLTAGPTPAFEAVIETAQDYYPFGSLMPGRKYNAGEYRFGFNGKEKDDEVTGVTGTTYDYGFSIYDSRIAKFLSIDPLFKSYPWYTPYQFAGNKPIWAIDLDGLEELIYMKSYLFSTSRQRFVISNNELLSKHIVDISNPEKAAKQKVYFAMKILNDLSNGKEVFLISIDKN